MKRTFTANVNGRIYNVDEDAYSLLQNYLNQLHMTFGGDEGREIVADIEARIAELFDERLAQGASVITLADVNRIIETMGRPEDIDDGAESHAPGAGPAPDAPEQKPFISINLPGRKRLFRNMQNKVFGGVISGLGTYLGWDISIMRLAVVLLAVFTYFWPVTIIYLIAWMVIPAASTSRQILEMYGEPVNVGTVGRTILESQPVPPPYTGSDREIADRARELGKQNKSDFFSTLVKVCANTVMAFAGLMAAVCSVAFIVAIIGILCALVASIFTPQLPMMEGYFASVSPYLVCATALVGLCFLLIPCIGLVWAAACVLFNAPAASKRTIIALIVFDMIFLALSIVLGLTLGAAVNF